MAMDYGVQRRPRRRMMAGAVVAMLVLGVAALIAIWSLDRANRMSQARAWTAAGPSCASVAATSLATSGDAATQSTDFSGVTFARAHGALRCSDIGYDDGRSDDSFPVCQFDHPGGLQVTTRRGTFSFRLPPLEAATVQVKHDIPECVVGSSMEIR